MRNYYSRRHDFMYYFKLLTVLCILGVGGFYADDIQSYFKRIDADKILAQSTLKDKTFSNRVQEIKAGGLRAWLMEEHSVPIVSIDFKFTGAGSAQEDEDKQGLTDLLETLLLDGAGKYDAESFKETCEEYGIKIGFSADDDSFGGYLHTPRKNLDKALEMLTVVLQNPRFDEKYIDLRKQQIKTSIKISMEKPGAILADEFAEFIFAGHPYSRRQTAKLETLDNVTTQDLEDFMSSHITRKNLIISFAGDISVKKVKNILKNPFAELPEQYSGEKMSEIHLELGGRQQNIKYDSAQSISAFAGNGTRRENVDFYPLYLANYIFGGSGLNSRISQVIREKEGLTYGISTSLVQKDAAALLEGSYSSTPENFAKAQELLLREWKKMAEDGVSKEELQQAKDALVYSFNLRFASISGIASMLTGMQQYNLGRDFLEKRNDYIKGVTQAEVNAAAKKYFGVTPDFVNIGIEKGEGNVRK